MKEVLHFLTENLAMMMGKRSHECTVLLQVPDPERLAIGLAAELRREFQLTDEAFTPTDLLRGPFKINGITIRIERSR
jgi:hypothetical protein